MVSGFGPCNKCGKLTNWTFVQLCEEDAREYFTKAFKKPEVCVD